MDDGRTRFVVLGLGDPHGLEGRERRQNRTTNPDGVTSLRRSNNLNLHGGRCESADFLGESFSNTREHSSTTGKNNVVVKIFSDIDVAFHDGVESELVETVVFFSNERGLEEQLRASETLALDGDSVSVWKFVALVVLRRFLVGLGFSFKIESNVAELLLDVSDDFTLSSGGEIETNFVEELHAVLGKVTTSQVNTKNSMGKCVTFVDGNGVGNTITRVNNDTSCSSGSVEGKNGLDGNIE